MTADLHPDEASVPDPWDAAAEMHNPETAEVLRLHVGGTQSRHWDWQRRSDRGVHDRRYVVPTPDRGNQWFAKPRP